MELNGYISAALLIVFFLISVMLLILLYRSMKREDAAVALGHKIARGFTSQYIPARDREYKPNRAYISLSEWGSDRGISFYRRETPLEVNIYIGAKGWNLDKCRNEGMMVTIPTNYLDMGTKENQKDVDDSIVSMILDMLLRDFGRIMKAPKLNVTPDESLLYSSKKQPQ